MGAISPGLEAAGAGEVRALALVRRWGRGGASGSASVSAGAGATASGGGAGGLVRGGRCLPPLLSPLGLGVRAPLWVVGLRGPGGVWAAGLMWLPSDWAPGVEPAGANLFSPLCFPAGSLPRGPWTAGPRRSRVRT